MVFVAHLLENTILALSRGGDLHPIFKPHLGGFAWTPGPEFHPNFIRLLLAVLTSSQWQSDEIQATVREQLKKIWCQQNVPDSWNLAQCKPNLRQKSFHGGPLVPLLLCRFAWIKSISSCMGSFKTSNKKVNDVVLTIYTTNQLNIFSINIPR